VSNVLPLILALISQHPDVVAGLLSFVVLGLVNGLLPTKVNGNIVTRVVSVLVDRLSPLTRKDARATLKWPLFSASVLRDVADAIDPPPPPSNGQSGRAHLGALVVLLVAHLGALVVLLVVGLVAGAVTNGCDPIREGVMRITPGVPSPSPCVPDSQRCAGAVPEVCSQSSMGNTRWWPSLSLRADGTQRVCSNGCVVDDAGVAGCAPVLPANPFADASVTSEGGAL